LGLIIVGNYTQALVCGTSILKRDSRGDSLNRTSPLVHTGFAWALFAVLPLAVAAIIFYPQPDPMMVQAGSYFHKLSVVCGFAACVYYLRHSAAKIFLLVAFPLAYLLSSAEDIRTLYEILLMFVFFVCGVALIKFRKDYVGVFVLVVGATSIVAMVLQLYGWPSWINALATHGTNQFGYALRPTLFVNAADLKAIYWQTRPAGLFSSNQFNVLFFFVFFATAITLVRGWRIALPLAALYAIVSLSKAAILGSILIAIALAIFYGRDYLRRSMVYGVALAVCFTVYYVLFPGVVSTYISPYVMYVSLLGRLFDLLDAVNMTGVIEQIGEAAGRPGYFGHAVKDAQSAFATAGDQLVDYGSLGPLTFYSEIVRNPLLSACLIALAVIVATILNVRRPRWWTTDSYQCAMALGAFVYTFVAPIGAQQSFWLFAGFGLVFVYGGLVNSEKPLNFVVSSLFGRGSPSAHREATYAASKSIAR
jgi:hypothetical protein